MDPACLPWMRLAQFTPESLKLSEIVDNYYLVYSCFMKACKGACVVVRVVGGSQVIAWSAHVFAREPGSLACLLLVGLACLVVGLLELKSLEVFGLGRNRNVKLYVIGLRIHECSLGRAWPVYGGHCAEVCASQLPSRRGGPCVYLLRANLACLWWPWVDSSAHCVCASWLVNVPADV